MGSGVLSYLTPGTGGYVLETDGSSGAPSWVSQSGLGTNYWQQVAGVLSPSTADNVLAATSSATTIATFTSNNPSGTLTNNTLLQETGAGTVTNLLNLTQSAGTVTNAIAVNGTVGDVLKVGANVILDQNGILQSAGLSGTYSNALTLSSATNSITAGTLTATGGTINGIAIGGSTPSSGAFTTLAANGTVTLSNATYTAGGLLKATAGTGVLTIAAAGTDYQVPLTFNNGLTNTSNTVQLGGPLTQGTSISFGNNTFTLGDTSGTGNLVVAPNAGGQAALIVNKQGGNDIFSASDSGTTKFTIGNDGSLTDAKYTTNNGLLYTNGTGLVSQAAAGTDAQLLLSNSGTPTFTTLTGDATIADTGVITLKNTGTAGTYGSASQVPVLTTDAQGRVTGVTNTAIAIDASAITSGELPLSRGGTGADLSGANQYSIPYVGSGVLSYLTPGTAGYVLETDGSGGAPSWVAQSGIGTNYWQQVAGVLSPSTADNVLAATSSATTIATFTSNNPSGTLTNNTLLQETGAGTVTNLLNLTQSAGTVTNAIAVNGTVGDVLKVGANVILDQNGILQSVGLSGTYSNALTLSSATNSITAGTLTATGGTINGIAIGGSTPSSGAFTTLSANGTVTLSNATYTAGGLLKATAGTGVLTIASAGTDYQVPLTFNNGLTNTSNTVQLGGPLTQGTSISFGNNTFTLGDTSGTGNLVVAPNAGGQAH